MSIETVLAWLAVACNLGLVAFAGFFARWYWNRRRWRQFEAAIQRWARDTFNVDFKDDEWKCLVPMKLSDAEFTPAEILHALDMAVLVAKGIVAREERGAA